MPVTLRRAGGIQIKLLFFRKNHITLILLRSLHFCLQPFNMQLLVLSRQRMNLFLFQHTKFVTSYNYFKLALK